jgi:hypothetical protein
MHYNVSSLFFIQLFSYVLVNDSFQLQIKDDRERIWKRLPCLFEGTIMEISWRE